MRTVSMSCPSVRRKRNFCVVSPEPSRRTSASNNDPSATQDKTNGGDDRPTLGRRE